MGVAWSLYLQSFPPKPKYSVHDIPDLEGKVVIVTGGNSGIGLETVKALLSHNAKVYLAARNSTKAQDAIRDLLKETGKTAHFLQLDLADLKSVKAAATDFLRNETQLHILFNNAGIMVPPIEETTVEGYDMQFGTNVLGHYYLTQLLLPIMMATAQKSPDGKTRVVNTAAFAHAFVKLDFNLFKDGPARRKKSPDAMYAQSKLGNVFFSSELARRYGDRGIVSICVNPGNLRTGLQRNLTGMRHHIIDAILHDAPLGALTQLYAGTSPEGVEMNGKYLIPWARPGESSPHSQDPQVAKELWTWLEEQVNSL